MLRQSTNPTLRANSSRSRLVSLVLRAASGLLAVLFLSLRSPSRFRPRWNGTEAGESPLGCVLKNETMPLWPSGFV